MPREETRRLATRRRYWHKERALERARHLKDPRIRLLAGARLRANRDGLPYSMKLDDLVMPTHCPALGIPLVIRFGHKGPCASSPTLDRVIPSLGYVPGNVYVISHRANSIKSNATSDEIERVLNWVRTVSPHQ